MKKVKKSFQIQNSTCIDVVEISDHVLNSFEQRCDNHKSRRCPPSPKDRVTGCRLEWGLVDIFGISMLCQITPTCCFEHCVCQAPERRLSIFVASSVCYLKKSLNSLSSHPRISDKISFYGLNCFSISPSSIPRGSRRALVRIGKTQHIEPRSHVMVEPEDIWSLVFASLY